METAFEKQSYTNYKQLWSGAVTTDASAEFVIPDNMPDICAVIDCSAILCIRSKEADNGRVSITMDVEGIVLYQSDDSNELYNFPIRTSTTLTSTVPDADSDCLCTAKLRIRSSECKIINSRKISFRSDISGFTSCYRREELEFIRDVKECKYQIEILSKEASLCLISDVREKTFVLTDDLSLPSGCGDVDAIMSEQISLQIDDVEFAGEKMVFRGRAICFLILKNESSLFPCSFESEFSQIIEISGSEEQAPELSLMLTGAYFDLPDHSGGKITAELHILAQIVCAKKHSVQYIADAYSNQESIRPCYTEHPICNNIRYIRQRKNLTDSIEAKREIREILFSRCMVSSAVIEDHAVHFAASVRTVFIRNDGSCGSLSHRLQESFSVEAAEEELLIINDIKCETPYVSLSGNNLDIKVPVDISLFAKKNMNLKTVVDFTEEEDEREYPSLTLLNCTDKENLWNLAKSHHSSVEAILDANDGRSEGLLLIPKCR